MYVASFKFLLSCLQARQLFLADPLQAQAAGTPETTLVPHEFRPLRLLLRQFSEEMLVRTGGNETDGRTFVNVPEYFIAQHSGFINEMVSQ